MSNALVVLAECVDARNGKRFVRGDIFDPPPNPEQARRLVAGGCLAEEALKAAVGPKTDAEAALEERSTRERETGEKNAKVAAEAAAKRQARGKGSKA